MPKEEKWSVISWFGLEGQKEQSCKVVSTGMEVKGDLYGLTRIGHLHIHPHPSNVAHSVSKLQVFTQRATSPAEMRGWMLGHEACRTLS